MSKTYIAAIASLAAYLLRTAGLEVHDQELLEIVTNVVAVSAAIAILVERWKRGDVHWHGKKK